jgi:protein translocase SecG subunit
MELFESILWVLFVFACFVVSGVILLQEGKGGGLGEAFGGAGQQTFGVKAAGINKFTGWASLGPAEAPPLPGIAAPPDAGPPAGEAGGAPAGGTGGAGEAPGEGR